MNSYYVYILASKQNGTLYIGVTNDLVRRIREHQEGLVEGFAKKYRTNTLVYFEECGQARDAIAREKQLKGWKRERKIALIESVNPTWGELSF